MNRTRYTATREPVLRFSPLGKRVYIITNFRVLGVRMGKQVILATRKFDVTAMFKEVMRDYRRAK